MIHNTKQIRIRFVRHESNHFGVRIHDHDTKRIHGFAKQIMNPRFYKSLIRFPHPYYFSIATFDDSYLHFWMNDTAHLIVCHVLSSICYNEFKPRMNVQVKPALSPIKNGRPKSIVLFMQRNGHFLAVPRVIIEYVSRNLFNCEIQLDLT